MSADLLRLARRVMLAIGRARITIVDDSGPVQMLQISRGPGAAMVSDQTPLAGLFGLASNPPAGADVILLSVGGDLNNTVAVASNHQTYRPRNLQPGDTCLHDTRTGQTITLTAAGVTVTDQWGNSIAMTKAAMTLTHSAKIVLSAPEIDLAGTGGPAVARVGDPVANGVITAGSTKVKAL